MSRRIESLLVHRLREQPTGEGKLETAARVLAELGTGFDGPAVELLAGELLSDQKLSRELNGLKTTFLAGLPETPNAACLRALLCETGSLSECEAWERFFSLHYTYDPGHRLSYARSLAAVGRFREAATQLRLVFSQEIRYSVFPRAEKLVRTVSASCDDHLRQVRVAVLGTSTTSLLVPVLQALCLRDRIQAEFYQGLYGAVEQEILDPGSGLARFRPDVVILMNHWRDLNLPAVSDPESVVTEVTGRHLSMWEKLSGRFACHIIQHAYDYPGEDPYGPLSALLPGGRARITDSVNRRMSAVAPPFVSLLDLAALQRKTGLERWEDAGSWHRFKQHPATEALPVLAEAQAAHLRAVLGLTRKVVVLDLDNTLWKGVIGEDGLQGIEIGPGTPYGEAHAALQSYLKDLKSRGILLAVCSKNNVDDARLPFEKHEHMVLRLDDFAAFEANWNDKAQNLRNIAERLSLGLESFVFLDDSPIEREWVRSQLPQVTVVEPGPNVFHYLRDLDRGQHFFALSLSSEDLVRAEQYRTESQRELLKTSSQSLGEFLSQLQLEASVVPVDKGNLTRVTQLANKTNQFNLTTRRYTEAQIEQLAARQDSWAGAFHLSDRMGSYGLIGLIFCVPSSDAGVWEIETWLMSCRALGRQMERFMYDRLVEAAREAGVRSLVGVFKPTAKNQLVEELYDSLGFQLTAAEGEKHYSLTVPGEPTRTASHVRHLTAVSPVKTGVST